MSFGVNGSARITPDTHLASLNKPIELAAPRAIDPYRQGLDGLCGVYSAINALRLALHSHAPLSKPSAKRLFRKGVNFLQREDAAVQALVSGMGVRRWHALVEHLCLRASTDGLLIGIERPDFADNPGIEDIFSWIDRSLSDGKPVLLRLKGCLNHFTLVAGTTDKRLELFDSDGLKFVKRSSCGVRTGLHRISPKALFRIAVTQRS